VYDPPSLIIIASVSVINKFINFVYGMAGCLGSAFAALLRGGRAPTPKAAAKAAIKSAAPLSPPSVSFAEAFAKSLKSRKRKRDDGDVEDLKLRKRPHYTTSTLELKLQLGREVHEYREMQDEMSRGWVNAFVKLKFPSLPRKQRHKQSRVCTRAYLAYLKSQSQAVTCGKVGRGRHEDGVRTSRIKYQGRRNFIGGGRQATAPELSEELWHWFIDTIRNLKVRLDTSILIAQCNLIKMDMERFNDMKRTNGEFDKVVELPNEIDYKWLARWRKFYGVTWRTRNICYKVSRTKLLSRLGVFWRNIIRFRYLWQLLFGTEVKFLSGDQKPFYFNNNDAVKLLAVRGWNRIECIEDHAATRERCSAMSLCLSYEDALMKAEGYPLFEMLFKGMGTKGNVKSKSPHCAVQWAERGSYRTEHVLDWLNLVLPRDGTKVCVLLDWYACHKDAEVVKFIRDRGHHLLLLGGGTTPWVQVPDTHLHHEFSQLFKADERRAMLEFRMLRPHKLYTRKKQDVLDKAFDVWKRLDHSKSIRGHAENGITNKLDGSDDEFLSSMIKSIWFEIKMPEERERIMADIKDGYDSKDLTSMEDYYAKLHEEYDHHAPVYEGNEDALVIVEGFNDALEENVDIKSDDEAWKDTLVDVCPPCPGEVVKEDDDDLPPLPPPKSPPQSDAVGVGNEEFKLDDRKLQALRESIVVNASVGNTQVVQMLEACIARLIKSKHKLTPEAARHLRLEREKRAAQLKVDREAAILSDQWDDRYKKVVDLMKHDENMILARAKCDNAALRLKQQGLKDEKKKAQFTKLQEDEANERLARFYACALSRQIKKSLASGGLKKIEDAVKSLIDCGGVKSVTMDMIPFWRSVKDTSQLVSVQAGWSKKNPKYYASKFLSGAMFGTKAPEAHNALSGPDVKFKTLVCACCPYINMLYPKRSLVLECLRDFNYDCDLAFVACVLVYSRSVGQATFPQGLHGWPPVDATWMSAVPELKLLPTLAGAALADAMDAPPLADPSSSSGSAAAVVS
jgi:hypothetical protein